VIEKSIAFIDNRSWQHWLRLVVFFIISRGWRLPMFGSFFATRSYFIFDEHLGQHLALQVFLLSCFTFIQPWLQPRPKPQPWQSPVYNAVVVWCS